MTARIIRTTAGERIRAGDPVTMTDGVAAQAVAPFALGELVTRDGSDVQQVVEVDQGYGSIMVECLKAPDSGWCKVGEREHNMAGRYTRIALGDASTQAKLEGPK